MEDKEKKLIIYKAHLIEEIDLLYNKYYYVDGIKNITKKLKENVEKYIKEEINNG